MLGQHRRRWPSIKPALAKMLAKYISYYAWDFRPDKTPPSWRVMRKSQFSLAYDDTRPCSHITKRWLVDFSGLRRSPTAPVILPSDDLSWIFLSYEDPRPHQSYYRAMTTCRGSFCPTWIPVRTIQITLRWLVVDLPGLRRSPSAPVISSCDDLSWTCHVTKCYFPIG